MLYSINAIYYSLDEQKSQTLPVFHALTSSDTTSFFKGKGKKSTWKAWQVYEEITKAVEYFASHAFEHLDEDYDQLTKIERLFQNNIPKNPTSQASIKTSNKYIFDKSICI